MTNSTSNKTSHHLNIGVMTFFVNLIGVMIGIIIYIYQITMTSYSDNIFYHSMLILLAYAAMVLSFKTFHAVMFFLICKLKKLKVNTLRGFWILYTRQRGLEITYFGTYAGIKNSFLMNEPINEKRLIEYPVLWRDITRQSYLLGGFLILLSSLGATLVGIPLLAINMLYISVAIQDYLSNQITIDDSHDNLGKFMKEITFSDEIEREVLEKYAEYLIENSDQIIDNFNFMDNLLWYLFACYRHKDIYDEFTMLFSQIDEKIDSLLYLKRREISGLNRAWLFLYLENRIYLLLLYKGDLQSVEATLERYAQTDWGYNPPKEHYSKYLELEEYLKSPQGIDLEKIKEQKFIKYII